MRQIFVVLAAIALAGCAAKLIDSNERTVMVNAGSADPASALKLANAECAKHGRYAKLNSRPNDDRQWVFDCVQ